MKAEFPEKLEFLFHPARYKVAWGGRGGSKSWGFARALLLLGVQRRLRILCARETMTSIADSVHKLLSDQIEQLQLSAYYQVQKASILGTNGTEFAFVGLRHNAAQIKSYESFDIAWVEEAQAVSKSSWEILIPTIRQDGSEIWVSFNPVLETDDTYRRFVTAPPPTGVVIKIGWRDNPWFPPVLRQEMDHLKATDLAAYNHIWEGCCVTTVEGAIYAKELAAVDLEQRITRVPYDPTRPVHTFWDLGFADETAIWCVQALPFEWRLIDYIEGSNEPLKTYQKALQIKPYVYGTHYLPHDAKANQLATGRSVEKLMIAAGFKTQVIPRQSVDARIKAARAVFGQCWFDGERCADGLQALRHYKWAPMGQLGQIKREPLHDWASNGSDAFGYFALGIKTPKRPRPPMEEILPPRTTAWS